MKPGVRPKGEYSAKSRAFTTRVTADLRAALDAAIEISGRSLSQEVEHRLRLTFQLGVPTVNRKEGPPTTPPKPGKKDTLGVRCSPTIKGWLLEGMKLSGNSLSQEIEQRLLQIKTIEDWNQSIATQSLPSPPKPQ